MRGWSLQWRSMNVPELRSGSFSAAAARRPLRLVPPAKRSRLMLHKYLRSRFAPGAPRRKHHRERGYASQSRACSSTGCSSPIIIPGDPREICQLTAAAFRFQKPVMRERASQQADPGIQDSRFAVARSWENSRRQAVRLHLPQATHTEPAPGAASERNWAAGSEIWAGASTPLSPGAWGRHCPARAPARDTDNPPAFGQLQAMETRT